MIRFITFLGCAAICLAQQTAPPATGPSAVQAANDEQEDLRRAVTEASASTVDLIRVLEAHLVKYPESLRRWEIERAILKAAIESKDERRIARYGVSILTREPDDLPMLDRVTRSLIIAGGAENLKKALEYSQHYEKLLRDILNKPAASGAELAIRKDDGERALGRALLSQAIATGSLGNAAQSAELAKKSFELAPGAESAAEAGRRLAQLGKMDEAVRAYADAFTVTDSAAGESERAVIRKRMGELYQKEKGSEVGLGDIVLKAYDRNAALLADRKLALRQFDPNTGLSDPLQFTLSGIKGEKLPMATLKGKAVILDFWATWCGPCRAQHPLYEEVMKKFAARKDVVFLSVNTDEERQSVQPFLEQQGWNPARVYYEDGLSKALRVTAIPTTVVFGRNGSIVSRMNGFDPERFVEMLTERINEALK